VQEQVLGLARSLRDRGHEARVLGPCDGLPQENFIMSMGNSIPNAVNGSVAPVAPDPAAALRTMRALRDEDFDVLHLHEPLVPGPTLTSVFLRPAPIVGTFHASGESRFYRRMRIPLHMAAKRIDYRCAVSDDARNFATRYIDGEYEVLWNGIDLDLYKPPVTEPQRTTARTILFLGRHEERKGLHVLLEAMQFLPNDVVCEIAGNGPETAALQEKYGKDSRFHWLGFLSLQEKIKHLQQATLYCAPSLGGESFGIVLVEAMAVGTPVVASDIDGYRTVVEHGKSAQLSPAGDAKTLALHVLALLEDQQRQDVLRQNGFERAQMYSLAALAQRYEEIYSQVNARALQRERGEASPSGLLGRMMGHWRP
jgi:phosphatidyl-myo-inositol alpha-mannosyltransferase